VPEIRVHPDEVMLSMRMTSALFGVVTVNV